MHIYQIALVFALLLAFLSSLLCANTLSCQFMLYATFFRRERQVCRLLSAVDYGCTVWALIKTGNMKDENIKEITICKLNCCCRIHLEICSFQQNDQKACRNFTTIHIMLRKAFDIKGNESREKKVTVSFQQLCYYNMIIVRENVSDYREDCRQL